MKLNFTEFQNKYITGRGTPKEKFHDEWASHLSLFPFTTNNENDFYDKNCSLLSTAGAFFRKLCGDADLTINNFEELKNYARSYLIDQENMAEESADAYLDILRDVFYQEKAISVTNSSLLKYVPLIPREEKKYSNGHQKFAQYLCSLNGEKDAFAGEKRNREDLFTQTLREALQAAKQQGKGRKGDGGSRFMISRGIREKFHEDYSWLMQQKETDIVKYLPLLFHFYICISFIQTVSCVLNGGSLHSQESPAQFFMVLNSERVSMNHKAIGIWEQLMGHAQLEQLFGKVQALDILNCLLSGDGVDNVGLVPEILEKLEEFPFAETKDELEDVLRFYYEKKTGTLKGRNDDFYKKYVTDDFTVCSYHDFVAKLQRLCVKLTPKEYRKKVPARFNALFKMRFVQTRRGRTLPVLDNEMLIFLMILATRGKRTKLQSAYNEIQKYGIYFNQNTKLCIEEYLLKMNLLERKSDSGEAKFVHINI